MFISHKFNVYWLTSGLMFGLMLFSDSVYGKIFSIDFYRMPLRTAIQILAKQQHINVMMSDEVQGMVTMHFQGIHSSEAFNLLLSANGLAKWQQGGAIFILPYHELMQKKQEELKCQSVMLESAPLVTQCQPIYYSDAKEIANLLKESATSLLSKRGKVRIDGRTNTLCIQEIESQLPLVKQLIRQLDVPVRQVMITARLAVVDSDYERELGFDFKLGKQASDSRLAINAVHLNASPMTMAKLVDISLLDIKLSALERAGHAKLISKPSLFAANQQLAFIESGEEVPYQESSDGGTTVAFKKAVLGLRVKPQILPGNKILLSLQINQDRPSAKMVQGVPTISTRQIVTNVLLHAGQTVVLGGIYEMDNEYGNHRVPFLSQLPILGPLFQFHSRRITKRELLIFVTPTLVTH